MFNLATVYFNGDGAGFDDQKALMWFTVAADAGSIDAKRAMEDMGQRMNPVSRREVRLAVARMYENGEGIPADPSRAFQIYLKEATDPDTQLKVSTLYSLGFGVPRDEVEAIRWCERAAKGGNTQAMMDLAARYLHGQDVAQNTAIAKQWYSKAAAGNARAALTLARLYSAAPDPDLAVAFMWFLIADAQKLPEAEDGLKQLMPKMTTQQVAVARKNASNWWKEHRQGRLTFPR
jgi:TPR repeat protein